MIALLLEAALRSGVLAAAVGCGIVAFRIRSPQLKKMTWTTVLVGSLAMPAMMSWTMMPMLPTATVVLPDIAVRAGTLDPESHWKAISIIVYAIVSLTLLARFGMALWRMIRIKRHALPIHESWTQGADVRVTAQLLSPATFGSTILLPPNYRFWDSKKRSVILLHEQAHVRHSDCQIQWLATLHACLFWFSPWAWWLRQHLATLAEHVSDDAVLRVYAHRTDYAAVLLEAARTRFKPGIAMSMATGNLTERIERILSDDCPRRLPAQWQRTLAIGLLLPAIVLAAGAAPLKYVSGSQMSEANAIADAPEATGSPYIIRSSWPAALERWYPQAAQHAGVEGLVEISVTLDEAGRATDTLVLSESPLGMGFGAAASELAHTFKYANPTGHAGKITYRVKFALKKPTGPLGAEHTPA